MGELKLINLADVQIEEIEWLWKPYIPKGKVTLVRGMPGEGKTMVLSSLVAALTNGDLLFNEEERHEPVSCIYQSAEDGLGDTIKPRLERGDAVQRNPCIHALLQCSLKTPVNQRRRHICHTRSCDSKNVRQAA